MTPPARPNILMVVFDSLGETALQEHIDVLPTLRALQSNSLHFSQAFTCSPESSPARASLFTGLDVAAHNLWTDGVALPGRETPLPEVFAQNGYDSWLVGRRHLAGVSNWTTEHARPNEYHHFDWAHGPLHRSRQNAYLSWLEHTAPSIYTEVFPRQADPDDTEIPQAHHEAMANVPDHLSFNAWVGTKVCGRVELGGPFFGVAGFVVGHSMGGGPALVEALDPKALRQADAALATVLSGVPQNTVIVVTAGRGCVGSVAAQPLNNAAIHVPLLLCAPHLAQQSIGGLVSTMDVVPTLCDLAQVRRPQRLQGQCLTSVTPRGWALSRLRHPGHPHQTALNTKHWKLVLTHGEPRETRLYDLSSDPKEAKNLAADPAHQDRLEEMLDHMMDARVALEDRTEPRIAKF
ncbi:sulfatase family protein [Tateyamaria pelophila]|uniref:sulfatase family protein n=1 Tax=Tateyamaria pelophila TaxID=328415 RepID=UPI001CBD50C6|nr:sulfatase-like hydrolase/transferase [Tateyamaria pelophila]